MNSKPKDPCSVVSVKNESHIRNVIHQNHSSEQAKKYKVVRDIYFFSLRKKKQNKTHLLFLEEKTSVIRSALSMHENIDLIPSNVYNSY